MTSSTTYPRRWGGTPARREHAPGLPSQRSSVITLAVAVAALGVIGYIAYVGATAPRIREEPVIVVPIHKTLPEPPVPLVKMELGLAES